MSDAQMNDPGLDIIRAFIKDYWRHAGVHRATAFSEREHPDHVLVQIVHNDPITGAFRSVTCEYSRTKLRGDPMFIFEELFRQLNKWADALCSQFPPEIQRIPGPPK